MSNDAKNVATTWITNFCPTQARVPDPKGRNAAFSFGSFSTNELNPQLSSSEPERIINIERLVRDEQQLSSLLPPEEDI